MQTNAELTVGEAKELQKLMGRPLGQLDELASQGDIEAIIGIGFIVMRRDNPDLTMEEVDQMDLLTVVERIDELGKAPQKALKKK